MIGKSLYLVVAAAPIVLASACATGSGKSEEPAATGVDGTASNATVSDATDSAATHGASSTSPATPSGPSETMVSTSPITEGSLTSAANESVPVAPSTVADGTSPSSGTLSGPSTTSTTTSSAEPTEGGGLANFTCPAPPYASSPVSTDVLIEKVPNVPPSDDFASSTEVVILEGPIWLDGNLYLSQINNGAPFSFPGNRPDDDAGVTEADAGIPEPPPSRILKVTPELEVSVLVDESGSNGLAFEANGVIVATNHKSGVITRYSLVGEPPVDVVLGYQGLRFNSPNDLTFGADGSLYFTDPDYQAPSPPPQDQTRAYWVPPGMTTPLPFAEDRNQPNGVTLSPGRTRLYLSASDGVFEYPVMPDGSLGAGVQFAEEVVRSSDGMAVDCAGNLYTTSGQNVIIVSPQGTEVGRISVPEVQNVTNVAFGGEDHRTIFITALGAGTRTGLFRVAGEIPGMPY